MRLLTLICLSLAIADSASAGPIVRDGLTWFYDPHTLDASKRSVIEIARQYINRKMPSDQNHRRYGGIIYSSGDCWEVSFFPPPIDPSAPPATGDDIIVFIDKRSNRVVRTALGQ